MWTTVYVSLCLVALSTAARFGELIQRCDVSDQDALNKCLFQIYEDSRSFMTTGIPEIRLPILDPMHLDTVVIAQGERAVTMESTFTQIQVRGLAKFRTNSVSADPANKVLRVSLGIPEMRITGQYVTKGKVFVLPVEGSGTFWAILNDVVANVQSNLILVNRADGKQILQVASNAIDVKTARIRLRLNNLFNGDSILGETVNAFLNENSQAIFEDIKPEISKQVNDLISKMMNDALSSVPVEKFLVNGK